jgi:hypothetical protein
MQLMNSDKQLGLGINSISKNALETEEDLARPSKEKFNKQSVDYDDTDFLQKMFSNGDNEIKIIETEPKNEDACQPTAQTP